MKQIDQSLREINQRLLKMEERVTQHEKFCEGEHLRLENRLSAEIASLKGEIRSLQIWDKLKTVGLIVLSSLVGAMASYIFFVPR